ncbi:MULTISPECIES: hypothetical protein [unclassified Rhizobium]|uniref:hypothetical protein n=1 Tax=unclassified Rhizobium TaxID=2613769 RepID=UPI0007EA0776|nr:MULTISPECIES: hypothetical protein [unclassified Rhizobium]ANM10390.1 hypothetical protein AMK05_CH02004 [Rhizobium sp. N324]ANM16875.1 hypothetical protein AMK06_CH01973 [Rhizobium sp. N541]ANM23260.1 hypothetical protein AMK07_CH01970 [Rhizobium sp. N941]
MQDLIDEAGNGSEDLGTSNDKPVSIRDSLRAAIDSADGNVSASGSTDRQRDEHGRFAPKEADKGTPAAAAVPKPVDAPAAANAATAAPQTPAVAPEQQPAATTHRVPPGWSAEAKAQFGTLPPEVQAAVAKREQEVDNGFRVLQDYKGLEEFTPIVRQAGTTHADVMRKAIDWETSLQRDPVNTVIHVARLAGVNLSALVNGQTDQILQRQPQQAQPQPRPQPVNVEATVEHVLRKRDTETQVSAFISDPANAHAEAVLDDMVTLIRTGRAANLKDAYDTACWMRPDIRQQLISQTAQPAPDPNAQRAAAADQARKASRSISGSSAPGPSRDATAGQSTSIRESLRTALHAARGQV